MRKQFIRKPRVFNKVCCGRNPCVTDKIVSPKHELVCACHLRLQMNILHLNLISAWYLNKCSLNMNLLLRLNTCSTFVGSAHISHLKGKGHSLSKSDFMPKYISNIVLASSDLFLKGIVYLKDKKYIHLYIYTEHAVRIL